VPLALKVKTELDEREAQQAAQQAERIFADAGHRAGDLNLLPGPQGLLTGVSCGVGVFNRGRHPPSPF
jgi:hypothetical protein